VVGEVGFNGNDTGLGKGLVGRGLMRGKVIGDVEVPL
jgi:hypothetical protein